MQLNDPIINHYTFNTGHVRRSPRAEVSREALDVCSRMLAPGEHTLPTQAPFCNYRLVVPECPVGWLGTVYSGERPLVTFGIASDKTEAVEIWPHMESLHYRISDAATQPIEPRAPWVAAILILALSEEVYWIADFERCMAWAWMDARKKEA